MSWTENLQVGDMVIVGDRITKVEKLTNTQIVLPHNVRYYRVTGRRVGPPSGMCSSYLTYVTHDGIARIKKKRLVAKLSAYHHWGEFDLEVLKNIEAIMDANK